MARINRAIELLAAGSGDLLRRTAQRPRADLRAGPRGCRHLGRLHQCRHGAWGFDMTGLANYMRGLVDGGPTRSGHRTPPSSSRPRSTASTRTTSASTPGSSGKSSAAACTASCCARPRSAAATRAFVESCRYPHHLTGVDPSIPSPEAGLRGASARRRPAEGRPLLGIGTRGRGSETTAAPIWGLSGEAYMDRCDPWPLNPNGELLLGVKLESPEGIANGRCDLRRAPAWASPRWDRAISACRLAA